MTDIWGRPMWKSIHHIALFYPDAPDATIRKEYRTFFMNLGPVLPCYVCSQNYARHMTEIPIDDYLSSRDRLFEWTVLLHNIVNKETGKRQISLEEARRIYTNDGNTGSVVWALAAAIVLCIPLGILGFYRTRIFSRYTSK